MKRYCILKCLILICLLFCVAEGRAQFDARFSQYWVVKGYYHPGWAGQTDNKMNIYGSYGMQLMGFTHAPRVMYFGADMPFSLFNKQHGVGVGFFNEAIGLFRNQRFWGQYAYQMKIRKGKLGIGLQVGMLTVSFDPSDINLGDETDDDAFPTTSESGTSVDLGVGAYYSHLKFYAAFSAHHLTAPRVSLGEKSQIKIHPIFYLTGGYNIQLRNPLYELQPSVFLKTDMQSFQADITARMVYNKMFNGGLSWRINESVVVLLGATFGRFQVGYAYDFPTTAMLKGSSGSHEVLVRYQLKLKKTKTGKNRHKSVRIL